MFLSDMVCFEMPHREPKSTFIRRQATPRVQDRWVWKGILSSRNAFSILEVVASVGVLLLLVSLAIPALAGARGAARRSRCLTQARSCAMLQLAYAAEQRDMFPNVGPVVTRRDLPCGWSMRLGGVRGLTNGAWAAMFPDEWRGDSWAHELRCPNDPRYYDLPMYWMSRALWLEPTSLARGRPFTSVIPFAARVSDVLQPSKKSLIYEQLGYCSIRGAFDPAIADAPDLDSALTLVDGSARRMRRIDGVHAEWTQPWDATIDGVRGRDVE